MDTRDTARGLARGARDSAALEWGVRAGLVGYGFVHLLVSWLAIQLALADSSGQATGQGALKQLAGDTAGRITLGALALGFTALALWQLAVALVGYRDREGWGRHLRRLGAAGRTAVYAYFAFASAQLALGDGSSSGGSPDSTTARVMAAPGGLLLVGAAGLAVIALGVGLAVFGIRRKFLRQLDSAARKEDRRRLIVVVGQVGYVAKGVAYSIIGALLCWAALTHDPQKSAGLDQALRELLGGELGRPAVGLIALGIGCFGLYLFARSRHLNEDSITSS